MDKKTKNTALSQKDKAKSGQKSQRRAAPKGKVINLQRIYLKDLSLEVPNAPEIFKKNWEPKVDVHLNTKWRSLENNTYEAIIKLGVIAKNSSKVAFIVELEQVGTFYIANLNEEELARALASTCPNALFPYVRETLDSLLMRASLPPMYLAQVNFDTLYENKLRQEKLKKFQQDVDLESTTPIDKSKIN